MLYYKKSDVGQLQYTKGLTVQKFGLSNSEAHNLLCTNIDSYQAKKGNNWLSEINSLL